MTYKEENNYPKAIAISAGIMAALIAISFFIAIGTFQPPEDVGMGGIVVNYGTSLEGMGDDYTSIEEPSIAPNANNKAPDKVVPNEQVNPNISSQTTDKSFQTQDNEEAVSINSKSKNTNTAPNTVSENKLAQPTINQNALYKGKANKGTGKGDGTTGTPGNQGDKDGDPLAPNYGEGGSGYGNIQLSLANRKFVDNPIIQDNGQSYGKIAVKIQVDKNGKIVKARAGAKGTTLSDLALWKKCEQAVLGASLNKLESAPYIQTGVVIINFKMK